MFVPLYELVFLWIGVKKTFKTTIVCIHRLVIAAIAQLFYFYFKVLKELFLIKKSFEGSM